MSVALRPRERECVCLCRKSTLCTLSGPVQTILGNLETASNTTTMPSSKSKSRKSAGNGSSTTTQESYDTDDYGREEEQINKKKAANSSKGKTIALLRQLSEPNKRYKK